MPGGGRKNKGNPAKGNISDQAIRAIWTANQRDSHLGIESNGSMAPQVPQPNSAGAEATKTAYQKEVERAIYGDSTGHPEPGTPDYFRAAENYAVYGDNFFNFPLDYYQLYAGLGATGDAAGDGLPGTSNQSCGPPGLDRRGRALFERKSSNPVAAQPKTPTATATMPSQAGSLSPTVVLNQGNGSYTNQAAAYMEQQTPFAGNVAGSVAPNNADLYQSYQQYMPLATGHSCFVPPTDSQWLMMQGSYEMQQQYHMHQWHVAQQQCYQYQQFQQQQLQQQFLNQQQQQHLMQHQQVRLQLQQMLPTNRSPRGIYGGTTSANRGAGFMPTEGDAASKNDNAKDAGNDMPAEAACTEPTPTAGAVRPDAVPDESSDNTIEAPAAGSAETGSSTTTE